MVGGARLMPFNYANEWSQMAIFILPLAEIFFPKLKFVASSSPFRSIPFKCMVCIRFGLLLNQITRTVGFFTIIAEVKPDQRINRMERNQEEDKTKPGEEKKKLLVWIKRHSLSFYFIFQISLYFCIALIFPPYHLHRWTVNKSLSTQSLSLSLCVRSCILNAVHHPTNYGICNTKFYTLAALSEHFQMEFNEIPHSKATEKISLRSWMITIIDFHRIVAGEKILTNRLNGAPSFKFRFIILLNC